MKKLFSAFIIGFAMLPLVTKAMDVPDNRCNKITGVWNAGGDIIIDSPTPGVTCSYAGTATVKNPKEGSTFSADISLRLLSGDCPTTADATLSGTCIEGDVKLTGSLPTGVNYDIIGNILKNGNRMPIAGTISYKIEDNTVVTAHLNNAILIKQ